MPDHELYMRRCLELASLGRGSVSPNPMVGAVIVADDRIIGDGFHRHYGGPHAEVNAIQAVSDRYGDDAPLLLERATIYVSLEPCAHFGKTPPCADLIIKHKIPRVVIGARDPFPSVNGKGIEKLTTAGINVIQGVLTAECEDLNRRFFTSVRLQRPYVILKWAQTADGFFAPAGGAKKWITSADSIRLVHKWRSEEDAVLIGKNTVLADNPSLTVREWAGRNPARVILDRRLELPPSLHIFDNSAPTIIFNQIKTETAGNTRYIELEDFEHYLPQLVLFQLYLLDFRSIIIEGGAKTLSLFIDTSLWDEARIFTGPQNWLGGIKAPVVSGTTICRVKSGEDELAIIRNPG